MNMTMTEPFTIPNVNLSGGPEIAWTFAGATARAELAGAKAYAEQRDDGDSDLRITDADGEILAEVIVRKLHRDESITVSLMNVGCALFWKMWISTPSRLNHGAMELGRPSFLSTTEHTGCSPLRFTTTRACRSTTR